MSGVVHNRHIEALRGDVDIDETVGSQRAGRRHAHLTPAHALGLGAPTSACFEGFGSDGERFQNHGVTVHLIRGAYGGWPVAKFKFLPPTSSPDSAVLLASRGVRAFADGLVSTALVAYLTILGFNGARIGLITSATLAGSGILTIAVGLRAHAMNRQRLLQIVAVMMVLTGVGFATDRKSVV